MLSYRIPVSLSALTLVALGGLGFAPSASADSVQVQSYQRMHQSEVCAAQVGETPWQAAWGADSSWNPTWELWASGGSGGWTCTRSITWAKDAAPDAAPFIGCVQYHLAVSPFSASWVDFGYVDLLEGRAPGSSFSEYSDAACSTPFMVMDQNIVYAESQGQADARCDAWVTNGYGHHPDELATNIYVCRVD